jgi:hypothetical protein
MVFWVWELGSEQGTQLVVVGSPNNRRGCSFQIGIR